jgi:hypothetical protein
MENIDEVAKNRVAAVRNIEKEKFWVSRAYRKRV